METVPWWITCSCWGCLSRLLQIGINGNLSSCGLAESTSSFPDYFKSELMETRNLFSSITGSASLLSRLLQIGINGNKTTGFGSSTQMLSCFPDYFKSELMETDSVRCGLWVYHVRLSRLLQIGINGNSQEAFPCVHLKLSLSRLLQLGINGNPRICLCYVSAVFYFPDYFKSELMETSEASPHFIFCATFPITSNRN